MKHIIEINNFYYIFINNRKISIFASPINKKVNMNMKKIEAIIEKNTDGEFSIYCIDEMFSGIGATVEEAKSDMIEAMQHYVTSCKESNYKYPTWLDSEYTIIYKFETQSLLQYYTGIITPAALSRLTGISSKQLWSYMHGRSKPRKAQRLKIESALHKLGNELITISL